MKVSILISHIVAQYNYTLLYKKTCTARTKVVERVFENWEDSYKELEKYLATLKTYASGVVAVMKT